MCFDWRWWGSNPCVIHPAQYTQIMKWIFLLISFPGDLWEQYQRWFPFCTFCRYLRAIGCFCDQKRGKKIRPSAPLRHWASQFLFFSSSSSLPNDETDEFDEAGRTVPQQNSMWVLYEHREPHIWWKIIILFLYFITGSEPTFWKMVEQQQCSDESYTGNYVKKCTIYGYIHIPDFWLLSTYDFRWRWSGLFFVF